MNDEYPKLRSDLIVTSETEGDAVFYTIKEPLTGRFFRLRAPEYYLLSRADGGTTAAQAAEATRTLSGIMATRRSWPSRTRATLTHTITCPATRPPTTISPTLRTM